jgi:hypothetical protein
MSPTWNSLPRGWHHILWVMLVSLALFMSACAVPGHSGSNPAPGHSEGTQAGAQDSGNGGGY